MEAESDLWRGRGKELAHGLRSSIEMFLYAHINDSEHGFKRIRFMKSTITLLTLVLLGLATALAQGRPDIESSASEAQPPSTNHVLDLDGTGAFVQLPPNIFTNLTEGTVEVWVNWRSGRGAGRFFSSGEYFNDLGIGLRNPQGQPGLMYFISDIPSEVIEITPAPELMKRINRSTVDGLIEWQKWYHIAAVSGPGGMKLYVNGVLLASHDYTGSFKNIAGQPNVFGRYQRHHGLGDSDGFDGQIDEFRVWKTQRTPQQIRENMYKQLSGTELNLIGLWNFETTESSSTVDAGPGGFHGTMIGNAQTVEVALPVPLEAKRQSNVLDLDGNGAYVGLPSNMFTNLTEGTVEAWVKWRKPRAPNYPGRFFTFHAMGVKIDHWDSPGLYFFISGGVGQGHSVTAYEAVEMQKWYHVAAVSGPDGMKLYQDGVLVALGSYTGSFSGHSSDRSILGWTRDSKTSFDGQIDEFRVWKTARTEEQIRENMFKELTGQESTLVGLWNFNDGTAADSSTNSFHGQFEAGATVVEADLPAPVESMRTDKVLDLNGKESFVELPSNIFTNLTSGTVEAWVKWRSPRARPNLVKFFSFGEPYDDMGVWPLAQQFSGLGFGVATNDTFHWLKSPGTFELKKWMHIAASSGPGGMKLYRDGVLVASNDITASFDSIEGGPNVLGQSGFNGQIEEFRVWNHERTVNEIRNNMLTNLTGQERGLVALWNFNDGTARDFTTNAFHGKLVGQANIVETSRPTHGLSSFSTSTSIFSVTVTDSEGSQVEGAHVILEVNDGVFRTGTSDQMGNCQFVLFNLNATKVGLSAIKEEQGAWRLAVDVQSGTTSVDLTLRPAVSISRSTLALDDSPLTGVVVDVVRVVDGEFDAAPERPVDRSTVQDDSVSSVTLSDSVDLMFDQVVTNAVTEANGEFKFINLKPGAYRLRCHTLGKIVYYNDGEILKVREKPHENVDFRMAPFKKGTWKSFTYIDGLAGDYVNAVYEDSDGAIWFGTDGGVSRWDGDEFFNLTKEDGLAGDWVDGVEAGPDGTLLFGTENGLSQWDGHQFVDSQLVETFKGQSVWPIYRDPKDSLWLGNSNTGGLWHDNGQGVTALSGFTNKVSCLRMTSDGRLWIGTRDGLFIHDESVPTKVDFNDTLATERITAIEEDSDGVIWIAARSGTFRYDGKTCENLSENQNFPKAAYPFYRDPSGVLWFGDWPGEHYVLTRFDGNSFVNFASEFGAIDDSLYDMPVVFRDSNEVLWVGTNKGVWKYNEQTFQEFTTRDGLQGNWVGAAMGTSEGVAWFSNGQGVSRFDGTNFVHLTSNQLKGQTNSNQRFSLVTSIKPSEDGTVWFGLWRYGVVGWDGTNFTRISTNGFTGFDRTSNGVLWMTYDTRNSPSSRGPFGLLRYEGEQYTHFGSEELSITNRLRSVHCDIQGNVWMGTWREGVLRYDGEKFERFSVENGLLNDSVRSISSDPDGTVWIGTESGLSRYDGQEFTYYKGRERLGRGATEIFRDSSELLWIGKESGVSRFDGEVWSSLDVRDGLISNSTSDICESPTGVFWIATDSGITRYQPRRKEPNSPKLSVRLDQEYDNLSNIPSVLSGRRVTFNAYIVDTLTRTGLRRFRWQVAQGKPNTEELMSSQKWLSASKETQFEWSAPRPGNYTIAVQYIDRDLNYSKPAFVIMTVVPPWYRNAWIVGPSGTGVFGLLFGSLFLGSRYYSKRREASRLREQMLEKEHRARETLEAKNRELLDAKEVAETANKAKSLFLANMSHEIRTPMNAILGYAQILQRDNTVQPKHRQALDTIHKSGDHLLAMINDILDLTKIEAGRMELQKTDFDLVGLIRGLESMFKGRCEQKGLNLVVEAADENRGEGEETSSLGEKLVHGDESKLRQVLINLLGNAVKFSEQGSITLRALRTRSTSSHESNPVESKIQNSKSEIVCYLFEVIDTGSGVAPELQEELFQPFHQGQEGIKKGGTGLGLAISQRHLDLMGAKLRVESEVGKGSRFYFEIEFEKAVEGAGGREVLRRGAVKSLASGTKLDVLIVDDIVQNRAVLSELLSGIGCQVTAVEGGAPSFKSSGIFRSGYRVHGHTYAGNGWAGSGKANRGARWAR